MTSLLLTGAGQSSGGVRYTILDRFATADDAPVTSPRTAEPGPGTLTFIQNDGTFAIASGKLEFTSQATATWGDQSFYASEITRAAGVCLLADITDVPAGANCQRFFGVWSSTTINSSPVFAFTFYTLELYGRVGADGPVIGPHNASGSLSLAVILRANGGFLLAKGDSYTNWTMLFVSASSTTATLYPGFANYNSAGKVDNFRVPARTWVPTPLVSDNFNRTNSDTVGNSAGGGGEESGGTGVASSEIAGDWDISSNTLVTAGDVPAGTGFIVTWAAGVAAVVAQVQVTLQANSVAGIVLSSDGADWYRVAIDDANNVFRVHEYDGAGTYTQRASTAVAIAASTAYKLLAVRDGTTVAGYVNSGSRVVYTSATVNDTATAHGLASSTAADAFDNFVVWNRTQSVPSF